MAKEDDTRQSSSDMTPTARAEALKTELFGSDLSVAEVAHILDVDRTTILRYLRDNAIFGYQVGREWRIPESDLRAYRQQLMDERRLDVRHAATELEIEKKLPKLNAHVSDDEDPRWRKLWCPGCGGPVLGELQFDEDLDGGSYEGQCGYCHQRVGESLSRRPWRTPTPVIAIARPVAPAAPEPEEDESDMPF